MVATFGRGRWGADILIAARPSPLDMTDSMPGTDLMSAARLVGSGASEGASTDGPMRPDGCPSESGTVAHFITESWT
jgi:hypothetical protein